MLNYQQVTEELIQKNVLLMNDIFDYQDSFLKDIFNNYFEYCQEYLTEHCQAYEIQPARFYFRNEYGVNAVATKVNGFFVIGVNMDTIQTTYELFYEQNDFFEKEDELSKEYEELSKNIKIPLGYLMFQLSTLFTFHHELTHLVQKSPLLNLGMKEKYSSIPRNKKIIIERHVLEFDADSHGAYAVCSQVLHHFKNLPIQQQSRDSLVILLSLGIATIYIYFILCFNSGQKLYYMESTHPHPLIRFAYIVESFIRLADERLPIKAKINPEKLTQLGFVTSNHFFKSLKNLDMDKINEFPNQLLEKFDSIENYINELIDHSKGVKNLMMNRA